MMRRTIGLLAAAALGTLAWPGPANGQTSLGGYSGFALAQPVHLEIFDPVIPLPSDPQVDVSIAYTKSSTETGPVSRATASYLWPGDVLGDGFSQLVGGNQNYPIQVNSHYPATAAAPATNKAQLTKGNGMSTSSNDTTTTARVTGLGVAGPNTDLLGGIGDGLSKLAGGAQSSAPAPPALPVPVSSTLAGIVTLENCKSISTTTLENKKFTSSAEATGSNIAILGGLIGIKGLNMTSASSSDGKTAKNSGHASFGGLTIAGQSFSMDEQGLKAAGSTTALPALPSALTDALKQIGISIQISPTSKTAQGASASARAQGIVLTIDTKPLRTALNAPFGLLQQIVKQLPSQLADQLGPLLNLSPKFVITLGDVRTSASASEGYTGGGSTPGGGTGGGAVGGTTGGTGGTGTGGGTGGSGGGSSGTIGGGGSTGTGGGGGGTTTGGTTTPTTTATAFQLPGLGDVPKALVLGGLVLAAVLGWLMRAAGGFLLGGGRECRYGLATGVPDLRKG